MSFHYRSQDTSDIEETKSEDVSIPSDPSISYEPPSSSTLFTKRKSLFQYDDEEEKKSIPENQPLKSIQTLSDIPNELGIADIKRFKSISMESRMSTNNKSRTIGWILSQLEEMGFEADPRTVRLTMRAYPPGTSRSFILETIVKDILRDEEDSREYTENMRESTRSVGRLRESEIFGDRGRDETFCRLCFILLDKNDDKFRVFACQDAFCRDCIYNTFKARIENNENIETFKCPDNECKSTVIVDRFATLIPEVNQKDLGDTELGTCEICLETILGSEELLKISQCQQHFYCYDCTLAYLKECISNRKVIDIKCPNAECSAFLDEEKIKQLLPTYLSVRYARFKKIAITERNPNIRWCSRPGCEEIIEGNPESPDLLCQCGQITCFICGNPKHKGKSCEQALEEEYKTYALQRDLQFCPECKSRVEKTEGCNHMTCPICTYEWCWLCKREYVSGHYDPLNPLGCPGLMAGEHTRQNRSRFRLILHRTLLFTAYILAILTSPAWLLIFAIMLPNIIYSPQDNPGIRKIATIRFLLFLLGLVLLPFTVAISIIAAIIPGSCMLVSRLSAYIKERRELKRRRRELIKNRDERIKRGEHFLMGYTAVEQQNIQIDLNNEGANEDLRVPFLGNNERQQYSVLLGQDAIAIYIDE